MTNLSGIIEKMTDKDKHHRSLATSSLLDELRKESFKADSELEIKLAYAVLQQLDDSAWELFELALQCLALLVNKLSEARVLEMTIKLSEKLLYVDEQNRDVASIALKTVVAEFCGSSSVQPALDSLTPQLIKGITDTGSSEEIKCECLDILCDVLHRYGNLMVAYHEQLLGALLCQLNCRQAIVRKKALCLASLASSLSEDLLSKVTVKVVGLLEHNRTKPELICTQIQMIWALSRSAGYHFGLHLGDTVSLLIDYCKKASENDEELQEHCLQALESFLLRYPMEISIYCDKVLNLTLEFISYDPNFTDNMEEDTDDENLEDDEDAGSANQYTHDEDASWKVRRAAAKCLAGLIVSRPDKLASLFVKACPKLIDRFKERNENVKMDVFNTFIELLQQTENVTRGNSLKMDTDDMSLKRLLKEVPKIVKSINRQLREKSIKTKVGAFSVLKELVTVLPGCDCLADQIGSLIPGIRKALLENSSTSKLKIETLAFTRLVLASYSPSYFHPHIKALCGPVLSALGERYYEVTSGALRVCEELVRVLPPNMEASSFGFEPYAHLIFKAIMSWLTNQNQDQECAITCMGLVISKFGDNLSSDLPACLPVLVDHMRNEITRLTVVKAFAVIAASPLSINLSCVLENVVTDLPAFLREANRTLRQATLETLNSMIKAYGDNISLPAYEVIIVELSSLISDSELHVTALALELCCTLVAGQKSTPNVRVKIRDNILPRALTVVRSSLLQGEALVASQNFFTKMVHSATINFDHLLEALLGSAEPYGESGGVAKLAMVSVAQCVAVLCLTVIEDKCSSTVIRLTDTLKCDISTYLEKQHLALLCLGEIGRRKDLSSHPHIENTVIKFFQSPFEEIKSAASYALGNVAVGNLSKYLPFILDQIDPTQKKQYLLIQSIKEVIVRQSVDKAEFQESSVDKILNLFFNHCECEEEGVRNVVAESLGKIALIEPSKLVPALKLRTTSQAAFTRATVVIAINHALAEWPEKIDAILYPEILSFLQLIKDGDRHVRRVAVLALNMAARNKPNLIKEFLPKLLPLLYDLTVIKEELTGTVDQGSFNPLELRQAAFECVDTLMDDCFDQVDPSFIIPYLKSGLDDHDDVKLICLLILSKLAYKCPSAVPSAMLAELDSWVDPLHQRVDRNEHMIRNALMALPHTRCRFTTPSVILSSNVMDVIPIEVWVEIVSKLDPRSMVRLDFVCQCSVVGKHCRMAIKMTSWDLFFKTEWNVSKMPEAPSTVSWKQLYSLNFQNPCDVPEFVYRFPNSRGSILLDGVKFCIEFKGVAWTISDLEKGAWIYDIHIIQCGKCASGFNEEEHTCEWNYIMDFRHILARASGTLDYYTSGSKEFLNHVSFAIFFHPFEDVCQRGSVLEKFLVDKMGKVCGSMFHDGNELMGWRTNFGRACGVSVELERADNDDGVTVAFSIKLERIWETM